MVVFRIAQGGILHRYIISRVSSDSLLGISCEGQFGEVPLMDS